MTFSIYIYIVQVLKANIRTFNSYAELLKLYNLYMHMYYVLIRTVEMLQKINSTVFISLLSLLTMYASFLACSTNE